MKIVKIQATNILSFESLNHTFEDEVVALVGENKTQIDQGSNGSGKSSIGQIVYFTITGDNIRKIVDKKMIRKGQSEGSAKVFIECKQRQEILSIERSLSQKGSGKLTIYINDKVKNFANVKDGNKFISDWIAISNEDLKSYFIVCKEFYQSIFKASNTEKLALISRFTNFSSIDKTKNVIESQLISLNDEKRVVDQKIAGLKGRLSVYEEQLKKEEQRDFEQEKEDKIKTIKEEISSLLNNNEKFKEEIVLITKNTQLILKEKETQRSLLNTLIAKLNELPKLDQFVTMFEEIKEGLGEIKITQNQIIEKRDSLTKKRGDISKALRTISINLSGAIICPKCEHKFLTLKDTSLEEERKKKKELEEKDSEFVKNQISIEAELKTYEEIVAEFLSIKSEKEDEEDSLKKQIRALDRQVDEIRSIVTTKENLIKKAQNDIEITQKRINTNEERIELLNDQIKTIKSIKEVDDSVKLEELSRSVKEVLNLVEEKEKALCKLNTDIFNKTEWIGRFKNFKMFLASEQIKNIQFLANEILKKENSDLRLIIEAFKKDSKGNQKDEITLYVLRDEVESFWYYSGGERAKVELATIMALQEMINTTNQYGGLQFLAIDEITEGLSEEGLYSVIDAMSFVKYPVLLATHIPIQNVKCKSLKIIKENYISRVI